MTQEELTLKWIKEFGSITSKIASTELGIMQLPKRIWNLKRQGYKFKIEWEHGKNRFGKDVKWCVYSLDIK